MGGQVNFKNYFVIVFDKPFSNSSVWQDSVLVTTVKELSANHVGAALGFVTKKGKKITARVASSFISAGQAELNLRELGNNNFDQVKQKAKDVWNKELGRIDVEGGSVDQTRTFYSCL